MMKDKIRIGLFMAALILPLLLYPLVSPFLDTENHENRTLAQWPSLSDGTAVFGEISTYFEDHLPYKNQMVSLQSSLFLSLFNNTSNPRVVVGQDGWLFYNNYDAENPMDDILGISRFSEEEIRQILRNLDDAAERAEESGTQFIFLLAPNKETVYREKLPVYLQDQLTDETRADLLAEAAEGGKAAFVYPKEALLREKENIPVYYRYDTHWNRLGGYIGFREVCRKAGIEVPKLSTFDITETTEYPKDLADLAGIGNRSGRDSEYLIEGFHPELTVTKEDLGGAVRYTSDAEDERTVLIVHDSFYRSMIDYYPLVFGEVISVDRNYSDLYSVQEWIDRYQPDIVIMEVVERGIQILLHENMPF